MSKHVLKSVALAIGALISGSVMAASVDLDAASPVSVKYANELNITAATLLEDGVAADQTAVVKLGASFGSDVTAYVRIEVAGGTLTGTPSFTINDSAAAAATVSVSQTGTGFIIYAVTPTAGNNLVSANVATFDTDTGVAAGVTVTNKNGVTLRYRLFETLTAAANPASNNTLKDTGEKTYISFSNAYTTTFVATNAVADVAAVPSYTKFTGGATTAPLGTTTFALATRAKPDGLAVTLADIFTATNTFTVTGNFGLARNDDNTYTGAALTRVNLNTATDCTGTNVNAATLTSDTATFVRTDVQLTGTLTLCLTAEGTPEISPQDPYAISAVYGVETGYTVSNMSATNIGKVTRNGVRMVAPLVNQPAGWFSRLVMTNTGTSARDYSISYLTEAGTTITVTGAGVSGQLAAGKTTLIDLPGVLTIVPGAGLGVRASLVVTVNAPQSEIDGLYQIVSPSGTAISNYVMVYK